MASRQLLDGESAVTSWELKGRSGGKARLVLTNLRVWHEVERGGQFLLTSLAIDEVQWAAVGRRHSPLLLIIAAVLLVLGLGAAYVSESEIPVATSGLAAVVLTVVYFLTRRGEITIGSGMALIRQAIGGAGKDRDDALAFVGRVEERALRTRERPLTA